MGFKTLCFLGMVLEFVVFTQAQWPPGFEGSTLPCASSCFASATNNWSSICASTDATPPTTSNSVIWADSSLPSCLSTACPETDYSSLMITNFPPNSYYPTSICHAWSGSESTISSSWTSTVSRGSSLSASVASASMATTMTAAATTATITGSQETPTTTSTDDSAEILATSVISGSSFTATATSNAASMPSPFLLSRSLGHLNSLGALVGFLVGMVEFF